MRAREEEKKLECETETTGENSFSEFTIASVVHASAIVHCGFSLEREEEEFYSTDNEGERERERERGRECASVCCVAYVLTFVFCQLSV